MIVPTVRHEAPDTKMPLPPLITVMALGLCASGAPIDLSQVTALNVDCNRAQPRATPWLLPATFRY